MLDEKVKSCYMTQFVLINVQLMHCRLVRGTACSTKYDITVNISTVDAEKMTGGNVINRPKTVSASLTVDCIKIR